MSLAYFAGLEGGLHNHLPRCKAWIDREMPYYALNYAHAGRIHWQMSGHPARTLAGPVVWWTVPGPHYTYGSLPGETWDHYYVTFRGPRAERMAEEGLIPSVLDCPHYASIADAEGCRAEIEDLFALLDQESIADPRAVHALEGLFLQAAQQARVGACPSPLEQEARRWAERMRQRPGDFWDIEAAAREMAVSPVHLRRVFRRAVGLPPHQFLLKARLDAAAQMLRTTPLPIKAIAERVGIEDPAYFSRLFAARYGFSPAAYRREAQLLST